jgi:hypothetical protein
VIRCAPARSFAVACSAAVFAVSVAGWGDRGDELGSRTDPVPTTVLAAAPSTTAAAPTLIVTQPPATTTPAVDLDQQLQSVDAELAELGAALQDFDQMTATTEGDPSR